MRVTGGALRGRVLSVPKGSDASLRPTSDKMRQAMFNILNHNGDCLDCLGDWADVACLDAYAGTGALGIEALSRGAREAIFWDRDPTSVKALKQTLNAFELSASVSVQDARKPPKTDQPVGLVFLDPPYHQGLVDETIQALKQSGWITDQTVCVCDCEKNLQLESLAVMTQKTYGDTSLIIGQPQ